MAKRLVGVLILVAACLSFVLIAGLASVIAAPTVIVVIPVGKSPGQIAVNPVTNRIYVTDTDNNLSVIDGTSNSVIATITGAGSNGIAINTSTNQLYIASVITNKVSVVDGNTNLILTTIPIGGLPYGVGLDPASNQLYVCSSTGGTVSVIDTTTNTVTKVIPVGATPVNIKVNSALHRAYVTNQNSQQLSVIDTINNKVLTTITVDKSPFGVDINPLTNLIYVSSIDQGTVTVIDANTNTIVNTIGVGGGNLTGLVVNPATNRVYVTNFQQNSLVVIDATTNSVIGSATMGSGPEFTIFNPTNGLIYVSNDQGNTVSVISDPVVPPTVTPSRTPQKNDTPQPAELIAQLRVSPDRVAANNSDNEISYTFKVKNIGQGASSTARIELPINPYLSLGYTRFTQPKVWVSALTTTTVSINLPPLKPADTITGTVVLRPQSPQVPASGSKVFTRYSLFYDDQVSLNNKRISNAIVFSFVSAGVNNIDESNGVIQLAEPYFITSQVGDKVSLKLNFLIPNEIATGWITNQAGTSVAIGNYKVDNDGKLNIEVDTAKLRPSNYVVAIRGNQSEITIRSNLILAPPANSSQ